MHINRNMSAVIANNQLLGIEDRLSASIERLSSGKKINRASDSPAGMAISNKMKAQIDALDQAEANAADGISVVQIADGALNEVSSILQRMRELSVQAANEINSYEDRQSIQDEISELVKEVDRISTDTEFNTKKLLDGSSDIRVYGDYASRFQVSDEVDAKIYTLNVVEKATQAKVELKYEAPQENGSLKINGVSVDVTAEMSKEEYLQSIRNAATEAGCNVKISEDNSTIEVYSDLYGYEETIKFSADTELVDIIGLTENEDCLYVVTTEEFRFDAVVPNADGKISFQGIDINITAGMPTEEYFAEITEIASGLGYEVKVDATTNQLVVSGKEMEVAYSNELADSMGIKNTYEGIYEVQTNGKDAVVTVPTQVEASGFTTTTTVECTGNRVVVTDNNGFSIDFLLSEEYEGVSDEENGNFEIDVTDLGSLTIQIGANEYQTMDVRIAEVSSKTLYIDEVDVSIQGGGGRAIGKLDAAIAKVSATRSRIGAFQNRLDYAKTSLSAGVENITAAYSGILDTDMAEEMSEYTQQNILNQAAISVLAQANELPQQVLSLLQQ